MASAALILWPFVAMAFFLAAGPVRGSVLAAGVGYLFLPEGASINIEGLPPYGKPAAVSLGLLLGMLATIGKAPRSDVRYADRALASIIGVLIVLLLVSPLLTVLGNRSAVAIGPLVLPGLGWRDVVAGLYESLVLFVPFFVARRYFITAADHAQLLRICVALGLCYAPLVLYELRMSPQLHNIVYGYFPHSWLQHVRGGGFRPLVFLGHGLWLGIFLCTAIIAAAALSRSKANTMPRGPFLAIAFGMFLLLAASHNLGALFLACLMLPAVLLLPRALQIRIAAASAVLLVSYPVLRVLGLIPVETALRLAELVSPDRAGSLGLRLENEFSMLTRSLEKPLLGWGGWGRGRVYSASGEDITTADGGWIIALVTYGWVGFIGRFGLVMAPLFFLARAGRRKSLDAATAGLALILGANLLYLIPNSHMSAVMMFLAGALAGYAQFDRALDSAADATPPETGPRLTRYTRFPADAGHALPAQRRDRPAALQVRK